MHLHYEVHGKRIERIETFEVERPEEYGGNVSYHSYKELEAAYENGSLSPVDLKNTVVKYLDQLLQPVREHFEKNPEAKKLADFVQKAMLKKKKKK